MFMYSQDKIHLEIEESKRKRLKNIHYNLIYRCHNPKSTSYKNYGGRGIKVCDEWKNDFNSFYEWAVHNGYASYLSIDRIDNDGDYCPENCRWVSQRVQNNNKGNTCVVHFMGKKMTLGEFVKKHGDCSYGYYYSNHIIKGIPLEAL